MSTQAKCKMFKKLPVLIGFIFFWYSDNCVCAPYTMWLCFQDELEMGMDAESVFV